MVKRSCEGTRKLSTCQPRSQCFSLLFYLLFFRDRNAVVQYHTIQCLLIFCNTYHRQPSVCFKEASRSPWNTFVIALFTSDVGFSQTRFMHGCIIYAVSWYSYKFFTTAKTSPEAARREKPLVTLDLNLTFMYTPAVKIVKLVINKGSNHRLIWRPFCQMESVLRKTRGLMSSLGRSRSNKAGITKQLTRSKGDTRVNEKIRV